MDFTKEQIRTTINAIAALQSQELLAQENIAISKRALELDEFKTAKLVCCYISVEKEVNSSQIIKAAFAQGKQVCVPFYIADKDTYEFTLIDPDTNFVNGKYDIPEPEKKASIEQEPDIIFVPAVAYDNMLNRIGHGKGYYDRMLTKMAKARKVGLAFAYQMVKKVPTTHHDVTLDKIVLADRTYQSCSCCSDRDSCSAAQNT